MRSDFSESIDPHRRRGSFLCKACTVASDSVVAYSTSGTLDGPWVQEKNPITPPNYGHGMLFHTLAGKLLMSIHSHTTINGRTRRIPCLFEADLSGDSLVVGKRYIP